MLRKYVTVKNVSDQPLTIKDRRLSFGKLELQPGEEFGLENAIWIENRRRFKDVLKDVSTLDEAIVEEETPAEFVATHIFNEEFVAVTKLGDKRAYFTKEDGSESWAKREDWDAEASEITKNESEALNEDS